MHRDDPVINCFMYKGFPGLITASGRIYLMSYGYSGVAEWRMVARLD